MTVAERRGPVLAVMGPTASGKTAAAVELARRTGGELVNADSRQAIAELEVGVCKPTLAELRGVPCAGLAWRHLGEAFSAADFARLAGAAVQGLIDRGRPAVLVGGTGLYLRSLLAGFDFGAVPPDPFRRVRAAAVAAGRRDGLSLELVRLAPGLAEEVDLHNPRRVERALELAKAGARAGSSAPSWTVAKVALRLSPETLRRRVQERSDRLVGPQLRQEIGRLRERRFPDQLIATAAIGYREGLAWVDGALDREAAVAQVATRTWRYARAQLTWLRREPGLIWVDADADPQTVAQRCLAAALPDTARVLQ